MNNLIPQQTSVKPYESLAEAAFELRAAAKSKSTLRTYSLGLARFKQFLETEKGGMASDKVTDLVIVEFIVWLRENNLKDEKKLKYATIQTYIAGIRSAYDKKGIKPNPAKSYNVTEAMQGLLRTAGNKPKKAKAITPASIKAVEDFFMINRSELQLRDLRDLTILTVGFLTAARISELASLRWDDFKFIDDKTVIVTMHRSKTDKAGLGQEIELTDGKLLRPCELAGLLKAKMQQELKKDNPNNSKNEFVFVGIRENNSLSRRHLSSRAIEMIIKASFKLIGIEGVQGHSLRVGYVTYSMSLGVGAVETARVSNHQNLKTLDGYNRNKISSLKI